MKESYVNDRKAYVERVRQSFRASGKNTSRGKNNGYEAEYDDYDDMETESGGLSFFRGRIILSIFLFIVFCFLHLTGQSFFSYSSADLVERIEKNYSLGEVKETIKNLLPGSGEEEENMTGTPGHTSFENSAENGEISPL